MACTVTLNTLLGTHTSGGIFTYEGYATTPQPTSFGPFSLPNPAIPGTANIPQPSNPVSGGYNAIVNFEGTAVGFYHFSYTVGSLPCVAQSFFVIQVLPDPESGTSTTLATCPASGAATINLYGALGNNPQPLTTGTWGLSFNGGANQTSHPNWQNSGGSSTDDVFNPVGAAVGQYVFTYTVTAGTPANGFSAPTCTDCDNESSTVTINVVALPNAGTPTNIAVCN